MCANLCEVPQYREGEGCRESLIPNHPSRWLFGRVPDLTVGLIIKPWPVAREMTARTTRATASVFMEMAGASGSDNTFKTRSKYIYASIKRKLHTYNSK